MWKIFLFLITFTSQLLSQEEGDSPTSQYGYESKPVGNYEYSEYYEKDNDNNLWFGIKGMRGDIELLGISHEQIEVDGGLSVYVIKVAEKFMETYSGKKKNDWKVVSKFRAQAGQDGELIYKTGFLQYDIYELESEGFFYTFVIGESWDNRKIFVFSYSLPVEEKEKNIKDFITWRNSIYVLEAGEEEEEE